MLRLLASLLYRTSQSSRKNGNCFPATLYKIEMFLRYNLDTLPNPISPNEVHLYDDLLQMNINVCSVFDDEGRARHPLIISRKTHEPVANLLYWNNHYAPITSITRLFSHITKHGHEHQTFVASDTFKQRKLSLVTRIFVPERITYQCFMFSLRQAPNNRKSNSISISIVLRRRL